LKAAAALLLAGLGAAAALAIAGTSASDEPIPTGRAVTVYGTITVTRTVERRVDGLTAAQWRVRAVANRRLANGQRITLSRIRAVLDRRWAPTASYAIRLAARVFDVDERKMRAVAFCESTMRPWAVNGRYRGLFQLGWAPYGLDALDPVANALSAAETVARDGGWRQWACG